MNRIGRCMLLSKMRTDIYEGFMWVEQLSGGWKPEGLEYMGMGKQAARMMYRLHETDKIGCWMYIYFS